MAPSTLAVGRPPSSAAEPPLDVQSLDEFLARFPAGDYLVLGETVDGDALQSEVTFTHDIPAAPVILSPAEEEELALDAVVIALGAGDGRGDRQL